MRSMAMYKVRGTESILVTRNCIFVRDASQRGMIGHAYLI